MDPTLACFDTCIEWIPQVHVGCDTSSPVDRQTFLIHVLANISASIGGARAYDSVYRSTAGFPCKLLRLDQLLFLFIFFYSPKFRSECKATIIRRLIFVITGNLHITNTIQRDYQNNNDYVCVVMNPFFGEPIIGFEQKISPQGRKHKTSY